ncbi:nucleotidyltransferase [Rossellomorea aquimaris]|uniref:nucleotidyltransferase n=1 Tax=Rossellomorea aquimaris TaxID=189382 RepID=UPI000B1031B0
MRTMKATGVIVEYNPFHNGHLLHLQETKKVSGADVVVAVMSGHFLQRGEPAIVSKWARARMALEAGVDLVIELPYAFATQHAETFAKGSISLLDSIGCDSFCFGSEDGDIDSFETTLTLINDRKEDYNTYIKKFVSEGMSYPSALAKAYQSLSRDDRMIDLSKPNNILGYHYLEARQSIGSALRAFTITRQAAQYHDEHISSPTIASATSIRKTIFASNSQEETIGNVLPSTSLDILRTYKQEFGNFHNWENYWPLLQYNIVSSTKDSLKEIYEIEEGIENRIVDCVKKSTSFEDLMLNLKTKRYTWTRLQRMLLHILTNTYKEDMRERHEYPAYIRLLGMNKQGREYLRHSKKNMSLPLISKLSTANQKDIALDVRAAEVYSLGLQNSASRKKLLHQEWSQHPIIL